MPQLVHLNGNILCAIDTETTGLIAGHHDLIQVCILPLDSNFEPLKYIGDQIILPFYTDIKPIRPHNADPKAMTVNRRDLAEISLHGLDPFIAAEKFDEWFQKLKLAFNKKISPLGHNYAFDRGFIREWLGNESYDQYFHYHVRDSCATALFLNDQAAFKAEQCPFPKVNMEYLCSQLQIKHDEAHDALQDCLLTAQVYKRMVLNQMYA